MAKPTLKQSIYTSFTIFGSSHRTQLLDLSLSTTTDALANEMFEEYQSRHCRVIWDFIFIFIYCNFHIFNFALFEKHNRDGKKIHIFLVFILSLLIYTNFLFVMNFKSWKTWHWSSFHILKTNTSHWPATSSKLNLYFILSYIYIYIYIYIFFLTNKSIQISLDI